MSNPHHYRKGMPRRSFLEMGFKGGVALAATPALLHDLLAGQKAAPSVLADSSLLNRVLARALAKGGDFAEIYLENRISRGIVMEESRFKSAVTSLSRGAGVRVMAGEKTGYATSDETDEASLLRAAEVASAVASQGGSGQAIPIRRDKRASYITVRLPLQEVADEKRLDILRRADQAARDYDPRIRTSFITYSDEVRGRTIANSEGLLLSDELPLLFFIVETLGVEGDRRHLGRERVSRHSGFEMFEAVTPEEAARAAARESVAMLAAEECPAGIMDVVIQNGWGGVLVHEAVGHPLEADNIARKVGAFTGKLGQKVASEVFTMVDDGTLPNARGTTNFDDEGTPGQRNVLIRNGVLEKYLTDILSAKQLGLPRTGNGRRESFRFMPIPRMTNTFIENGKDNAADILASTAQGLYVQSLSGGSVNPITGVFNFTCRESYLIENGRKTKPVRGATLIGSCLDIIQKTDAVGNDLAFGSGICGKGQNAEVDAGQPTVRIRGINVGGSRGR